MLFDKTYFHGNYELIKFRYLNESEQLMFESTNTMVLIRCENVIYDEISWYIIENKYSNVNVLIYKYHRKFTVNIFEDEEIYILNLEKKYQRKKKINKLLIKK